MNSRNLVMGSVIAACIAIPSVAEAACTKANFANKIWKLSAQELSTSPHNILFFCQFKTSAAGTIALTPNGCQDYRIGGDTDFSNPDPYDIDSGTITFVSGCTFDITMSLAGGTIWKSRVVLDSGKTTAAGSFFVDWGGGGSVTLLRQ